MAKYRKLFIILGFLSTIFSILLALFTQQWLWLGLGLVGACFILIGVSLQIRDLSHFLKTRERKNEQLAARIGKVENNLEVFLSESAEFRSEVAKEFTGIKASYLSTQRNELENLNASFSSEHLSATDLLVFEPDNLRIVKCLTAHSGKKTLFLGSEGRCNFVEKLVRNIPNLDVDIVPMDQLESKVITTIGQYELLLVWLPSVGDLPSIVPFSWIANSEANIFVGPAGMAKMMDIQRLNYGTPVTLVIEKEIDNLLEVKVVRSIEN